MSHITFSLSDWQKICKTYHIPPDNVLKPLNTSIQNPRRCNDKVMVEMYHVRKRRISWTCDAIQSSAPTNIPFEKKDREEKLKICGLVGAPKKTCAICGRQGTLAQGDHIWGRMEYYTKTKKAGIVKGKWNTLPVCSRTGCNKSYKKITLTNGVKKDIGKDELTEAELNLVSPKDEKAVDIVRKWKAYAKGRGAVLWFELDEEQLYTVELMERLRDQHIACGEELLTLRHEYLNFKKLKREIIND